MNIETRMRFYFIFWCLLSILSKPFRVLAELDSLPICCPIAHLDGGARYWESLDCDKELSGKNEIRRVSSYEWQIPSQLLDPARNETVRLVYRNITCNAERRKIQIDLSERRANLNQVNNSFGRFNFSSPSTTLNKYFLRGYFQDDKDYYHKNEFCLNKFNSSFIEIETCEPTCMTPNNTVVKKTNENYEKGRRTTTCIPKCCRLGFSLTYIASEFRAACVPSGVNLKPTIYSDTNYALSTSEQESIDFHYRRTKITCENGSSLQLMTVGPNAILHPLSQLCFRMHKDGSGFHSNKKMQWEPATQYCVDAIENLRSNETDADTTEHELGVMMCSLFRQSESKVDSTNVRRKLYGGLMISASIFLLFTFVVYALLWDQRGLHGWTTMGHSASMFFTYNFLGVAHILIVTEGESILGKFSCIVTGVLAHFFFLSSFCWLTLICFDLWFTFKSFNPKSSRSKGIKRFVYYVFFGWGVPTAIIIISLVLDSLANNSHCSSIISPRYGVTSCYVFEEALGEYIYYPIAALLVLNLLLFSVTTWKIYEYKKSTRMATSNLENNQQFFKLCIKLNFVMGLTWIFEVISWLHVGTSIPWYWTILDCINIFQALAIFVIYVCKKETVLALDKKYPCLAPVTGPLMRVFKWKQTSFDPDQSTLNSSSQRSHERTRESALSDDSVRVSTTYMSLRRGERSAPPPPPYSAN